MLRDGSQTDTKGITAAAAAAHDACQRGGLLQDY